MSAPGTDFNRRPPIGSNLPDDFLGLNGSGIIHAARQPRDMAALREGMDQLEQTIISSGGLKWAQEGEDGTAIRMINRGSVLAFLLTDGRMAPVPSLGEHVVSRASFSYQPSASSETFSVALQALLRERRVAADSAASVGMVLGKAGLAGYMDTAIERLHGEGLDGPNATNVPDALYGAAVFALSAPVVRQ